MHIDIRVDDTFIILGGEFEKNLVSSYRVSAIYMLRIFFLWSDFRSEKKV